MSRQKTLQDSCSGFLSPTWWLARLVVALCFVLGMALPAVTEEKFLVGVNYPWAAYGHDFGENAWGRDGMSTGGWTRQTFQNSQGFTDVRPCKERAYRGKVSLCITADLVGQDPHKTRGEAYRDLVNHLPRGVAVPVNLEGATARCRIWLPPGSAGNPGAPNGVQLIFKSEGWWSWYSPWFNIQSEWEGRWVEITTDLSKPAGFKDPQFDVHKVIALGVKVAINDSSAATLKGSIYLDDYVVNANPPLTFTFEKIEVERDFITLRRTLQKCSLRVLRVFVFADGRAAPDFTVDGEIEGLDKYVFPDLDALFTVAEQQNLLLIPVLLDFWWFDSPKFVNGVQLGGHSDIIRDPTKRQSFLDRVLKPLVERYRDSDHIAAIDIINEPEWAMKEIPKDFAVGDPITVEEMREFVRLCAETIHTHSHHKVTVGSARRGWLHYWQGLGLDLYQFHWYDHFAAEESFPWAPYAELGLDKPCIIGEVPTANTQYSTEQYLRAARDGGYHGVLVWSYRALDEFSNFSSARRPLKRWCANR